MKRIDFLGAPGIGKSTIYIELVKRRAKSDSWMIPEEAWIKIARQYSTQNAKSGKDYIIAALLRIGLFNKIYPDLSLRVLHKNQKEIIWNEREHYANFFEAALQSSTIKEKIPLRRLGGIKSFYSVARDVIFLEHSRIPGLVLFDESLSQKIFGVTMWREGMFESATNNYFNTIPLPEALIYCKLNPDETLNRIKQRGKIIPGHRDLDGNLLFEAIKVQLRIAAMGADILKNRGAKVLEIHTEDSLEENAEKITDAIRRDFV